MNVLKRAGVLVLAMLAVMVSFTQSAAAEVARTVGHGFNQFCGGINQLLLWGGANAAHLCIGAVGDLSKVETTRVRMLKTVSNPHTTWFAANEEEGRDGLYDIDPEVARAWIRDGVAEAVGSGAAAATMQAEGDTDAPRADAVNPDLQAEAQPVNAEKAVRPAATSSKKS
jgi:hypothetical protein